MKPRDLARSCGGRFSTSLGLDLQQGGERACFQWFLAAILYGARISEVLATRTWLILVARGVTSPQRIVETGWDGLVAMLDAGGYARYDFKTATKLLEVCNALLQEYGSLVQLHAMASDARDLEARLKALGKGIGDTTVEIFLRELRGIWPKADPLLSPLALQAARHLHLLPPRLRRRDLALRLLRQRWKAQGGEDVDFADFESALVREGLRLRRAHAKQRSKRGSGLRVPAHAG